MTTTLPIILRELPAPKSTDPAAIARNARSRYSAEWETPEGIGDDPDPLWSVVGFGPDEQGALADLAARTAHNWHSKPDSEIRVGLGKLPDDLELMNAAIELAERYAQNAFNAVQTTFNADERLRMTHAGSKWSETRATLLRIATSIHNEHTQVAAEAESTRPSRTLTAEYDAGTQPEVCRALGALFLALPSEVKRSQTFGLSFKGEDGRHVIAVVATRDPQRLAEFVRMGVIEPAADTPLSDCPQNIADQLTDEVTFTSPDGRVFTGSPAGVGVEVAEAMVDHEGETWSLPSVIRAHAVEHLARVVDASQWSPWARAAAYHFYRLTNAAPDPEASA